MCGYVACVPECRSVEVSKCCNVMEHPLGNLCAHTAYYFPDSNATLLSESKHVDTHSLLEVVLI
jgi:hypothetical protein